MIDAVAVASINGGDKSGRINNATFAEDPVAWYATAIAWIHVLTVPLFILLAAIVWTLADRKPPRLR